MFDSLFGKRSRTKFEEGKMLYELGASHAAKFECNETLDLYSKSIDAFKDPAPYVNRAHILLRRLRFHEAASDLYEAKRLSGGILAPEVNALIEEVVNVISFTDERREELLEEWPFTERNGYRGEAARNI